MLLKLVLCASIFWPSLSSAQNIFTITGYPLTHRDSVDTQQALNSPLGSTYGLLIDKVTSRLLFHDETLVLRLEPDGSLLTIAGLGLIALPPPQVAGFASLQFVKPASFLRRRRPGTSSKCPRHRRIFAPSSHLRSDRQFVRAESGLQLDSHGDFHAVLAGAFAAVRWRGRVTQQIRNGLGQFQRAVPVHASRQHQRRRFLADHESRERTHRDSFVVNVNTKGLGSGF